MRFGLATNNKKSAPQATIRKKLSANSYQLLASFITFVDAPILH